MGHDLESRLFTEDKDWLSGTYKTTEEAFVVAEYFARYVRKRWPGSHNSSGDRGHLYLELIDVVFKPPEEVPRKLLKLGYASDTLLVLLPDHGYGEEQKEVLRDFYQQKYASVVKESHARTNALLWQTFSADERSEILGMFKENSTLEGAIKTAILNDLGRENPLKDSEIIKLQTEDPNRKASDDKA